MLGLVLDWWKLALSRKHFFFRSSLSLSRSHVQCPTHASQILLFTFSPSTSASSTTDMGETERDNRSRTLSLGPLLLLGGLFILLAHVPSSSSSFRFYPLSRGNRYIPFCLLIWLFKRASKRRRSGSLKAKCEIKWGVTKHNVP